MRVSSDNSERLGQARPSLSACTGIAISTRNARAPIDAKPATRDGTRAQVRLLTSRLASNVIRYQRQQHAFCARLQSDGGADCLRVRPMSAIIRGVGVCDCWLVALLGRRPLSFRWWWLSPLARERPIASRVAHGAVVPLRSTRHPSRSAPPATGLRFGIALVSGEPGIDRRLTVELQAIDLGHRRPATKPVPPNDGLARYAEVIGDLDEREISIRRRPPESLLAAICHAHALRITTCDGDSQLRRWVSGVKRDLFQRFQ